MGVPQLRWARARGLPHWTTFCHSFCQQDLAWLHPTSESPNREAGAAENGLLRLMSFFPTYWIVSQDKVGGKAKFTPQSVKPLKDHTLPDTQTPPCRADG